MSAQTRYGFSSPIGFAGGIVDMGTPYAIDSRINEADTGVLKFGMGVVVGTNAGSGVKLPVESSTLAQFEGIIQNGGTTEYDVEGKLSIRNGASVGVMRYGRIYVRVAKGVSPAYGDSVWLITSGDEAGCFTNANATAPKEGETAAYTAVNIKARFLCGYDASAQIAAVELFNDAQ